MTLTKSLLAATLASLLLSGASFAQTPPAAMAPAAASPVAPTKTTPSTGMDKKAISKACSDEADKQGLKGKPRKSFRSKCKHDKLKGM